MLHLFFITYMYQMSELSKPFVKRLAWTGSDRSLISETGTAGTDRSFAAAGPFREKVVRR